MEFPGILRGKRVFIRRDREDDGFDGVISEIEGKWIKVRVADTDPNGFDSIWINTELQREIGELR